MGSLDTSFDIGIIWWIPPYRLFKRVWLFDELYLDRLAAGGTIYSIFWTEIHQIKGRRYCRKFTGAEQVMKQCWLNFLNSNSTSISFARSYIPGICLSPFVSCPMHKRNYGLTADKEAGGGKCLNDDNVSIANFPIEAQGEDIWVKLLLRTK